MAIIGIVLLFYGLQFLKGLSVFSSDNAMYVAFSDATGLAVSSPVYANGYRVGVVKSLDYDYDPHGKIVAEIGLNKEMRVPVGSRAELASDLLGNIKINLVLSDDPIHMIGVGDIHEVGLRFLKHSLVIRIDKASRSVCLTKVDSMLHAFLASKDASHLNLASKLVVQHPHDLLGYLSCSCN